MRVRAGVSSQLEDCHVVVEGPGIVVRVSDDSLHAVSAVVRLVVYGNQRQILHGLGELMLSWISLSKQSKLLQFMFKF